MTDEPRTPEDHPPLFFAPPLRMLKPAPEKFFIIRPEGYTDDEWKRLCLTLTIRLGDRRQLSRFKRFYYANPSVWTAGDRMLGFLMFGLCCVALFLLVLMYVRY